MRLRSATNLEKLTEQHDPKAKSFYLSTHFSNLVKPLVFAFECPHCGVYSTFKVSAEYGNEYWGGFAKILLCDHCSKLVYVVLGARPIPRGQTASEEIKDYYPKRKPKLEDSIPKRVASDYVEAIKCFDVGAEKASAAMCRRALQNSIIEKGAKKGKLVDQIDELFEKQIITKDIKDWAHEIRLTGNVGAHPDEDGLQDVSPKEAKELLEFMEEYLNYVYVMPDKVAKKRAEKKGKATPKKEEVHINRIPRP
jgi:hypothetical protein